MSSDSKIGGIALEKKPRTSPSKSAVYETLKADILLCNLKPGEPLSEEVLVNRFKVSRTPVREALGALEAERLVTRVHNKGVFVRSLSIEEIHDLFQMRELLECHAVRAATPRISSDTLQRLHERLASHQRSPSTDPEDRMRLDRDFHVAIATESGNRYLSEMVASLHDQSFCVRYRACDSPKADDETTREHVAIVIAMTRRSLDEAEKTMRVHIQETVRRILLSDLYWTGLSSVPMQPASERP